MKLEDLNAKDSKIENFESAKEFVTMWAKLAKQQASNPNSQPIMLSLQSLAAVFDSIEILFAEVEKLKTSTVRTVNLPV